MAWTDQPVRGADVAQISERGVVAGEQKMIAVVDGHADGGIVIGAAAAAGKTRRLVHNDAAAALRQLQRRRQAGQAGADDVHGSSHREFCITRDCVPR
jgi:hypothetical protein